MTKVYTPLQVEAIACAWEHMLDNRDKAPFAAGFYDLGTVSMRHRAIALGCIIEGWFQEWVGDDPTHERRDALGGYPYDWEIIPAMLTIAYTCGTSATCKQLAFSKLDQMAEFI